MSDGDFYDPLGDFREEEQAHTLDEFYGEPAPVPAPMAPAPPSHVAPHAPTPSAPAPVGGSTVETDERLFPTSGVMDRVPEGISRFFKLAFYQQFFDVSTTDFKDRALQVMLFWKSDFLTQVAAAKPDLWGPFWISTTLIFLLFFCSQLYIIFSSGVMSWALLSFATTALYGYTIIAPLVVSILGWFFEADLTFIVLLCIYGYSLLPLLPATILLPFGALIPKGFITGLFIVMVGWSAAFLFMNLRKYFMALQRGDKLYWIMLGVVVGSHLLCLGYISLHMISIK
eukprot:gnl/Dysnectes_brevis/1275_a1429_4363.p1 GENE.gnl/Dysnectes_brevis/1275_a1429_4363~~gnl/Dysnectes_brevis/1275_a1429_4363.p1  ORF type:complete len:299 (+),score=79.66 gnl/Dysnectes_brevis/1275_a1429_4363:43-897(+)